MTGIVHLCEHPGCTAWGTWGEGSDLRRGKLGRWWCTEHRPSRLDPARHAAKPSAPNPSAPQGQGRLL